VLKEDSMTTFELKNMLFHKIAGIYDISFLSALNSIIETKSNDEIYQTMPALQLMVNEGCEQNTGGESYTNEEVEIEIDKWLSEE
jgi:hypothetical protein